MLIRIATRRSKLALIQTDLVIKKLKECFPNIHCEIVPVITTGDKITDKNLYDIGGKALFLKELEEKLLTGEGASPHRRARHWYSALTRTPSRRRKKALRSR